MRFRHIAMRVRPLLLVLLVAGNMACAIAARPLRPRKLKRWGVPCANYSGICRLPAPNDYAVVSDKETSDGFYVFTIKQDLFSGQVVSVSRSSFKGNPKPRVAGNSGGRDTEDLAFFPEHGTLFITGEGDQEILEYDTLGVPTGRRLAIPPMFAADSIWPNRGFESLCYDTAHGVFWTATESPLRRDGKEASPQQPRANESLRLLQFGSGLECRGFVAYRLDKARAHRYRYYYTHGVSAITSLPDGRLLVLEREINIPRRAIGGSVRHAIYLVDPQSENLLPAEWRESSIDSLPAVRKRLVARFTTRLGRLRSNLSNYEGMCLGRRLADGRLTLLLINDSQDAAGNRLFRLKDYLKVIILDAEDLR